MAVGAGLLKAWDFATSAFNTAIGSAGAYAAKGAIDTKKAASDVVDKANSALQNVGSAGADLLKKVAIPAAAILAAIVLLKAKK